MNGGSCIDGVDNFTCSCPPRLTGPLCECLILDDGSNDCEYVSPTPGSTQSVLTTFIFEGSTYVTSTISGYNDTSGRTVLTTESENFTSIGFVTTEREDATTDQSAVSTGTNIQTVTVTADTTDKVATEEVTKQTIESESSRTETITDSSYTNPPSPPIVLDTTTDSISLKTTKDLLPTELTTSSDKDGTAEITSTPKADSTDKMFTDTPTEHGTELPTPPTFSTTEAVEVTTGNDAGTHLYTTMQSECTDSFCNNHGTCINSPHGIRVS